MQRETLSDLVVFPAVAQERSFSRAAACLTEIVINRFFAGIRPGDQVDHHRVAVPVSQAMRLPPWRRRPI